MNLSQTLASVEKHGREKNFFRGIPWISYNISLRTTIFRACCFSCKSSVLEICYNRKKNKQRHSQQQWLNKIKNVLERCEQNKQTNKQANKWTNGIGSFRSVAANSLMLYENMHLYTTFHHSVVLYSQISLINLLLFHLSSSKPNSKQRKWS